MEMKRTRRLPSPSPPPSPAASLDDVELATPDRKPQQPPPGARPSPRILLAVLLACALALPTLLLVLRGAHHHDDPRRRDAELGEATTIHDFVDGAVDHSASRAPKDRLLGGLLAPGFDEGSCLSRYQSAEYRKESPHRPSPHLLEKIRKYEVLHKRCGPGTEPFRKAIGRLTASNWTDGPVECRYVVWISYSGLGNRILTLVSTFLYAILTERVLLVDRGVDMADLFCEPFLDSTWLLPTDFPVNRFDIFDQRSPQSYGSMLKSKAIDRSAGGGGSLAAVPSYMYLHLAHDYDDNDKFFFCGEDQKILQQVPWTILRSDNYFVPSLFLSPAFEDELPRLFPEKDTVFHHLARYLFHPTNAVWGLITRYHQAYLARTDERIGIQIRVFDDGKGPFQHVLDQILSCTSRENILPEVKRDELVSSSPSGRSKSVLLTSLSSGYFEMMRNLYWEHPVSNGEIVSIYQPSHEEYQQTEKQMHNMKALAEMYLLSMADKLVISSWSTFGYVAQGLSGARSWIMMKPENMTVPDPPCRRTMSMEPCFHAPPFYDCKEKRGVDTGALVPHVQHCEDMSWGLKLVNRNEW